MFYTSIKRKKIQYKEKNFLWSHLFKETYLLTLAKELIIRWPPSSDLHGYQTLFLITYVHLWPQHASLGLGGSINPQIPKRRDPVCCTSDLWLIPAKLASQWCQWQETDTSPGYLSSQFLSKERNTLKNHGGFGGLKEGHVFVSWRERKQLCFHSISPL